MSTYSVCTRQIEKLLDVRHLPPTTTWRWTCYVLQYHYHLLSLHTSDAAHSRNSEHDVVFQLLIGIC